MPKNLKGFFETSVCCKLSENLKGALWRLKIRKKSIEQKKIQRGDPLGFFDTHCVAKYRNKRRIDPLVESKKFQKKSIVPKKIQVKNTIGGSLVYFRGSGRRCFCFGRGSGVSSKNIPPTVRVGPFSTKKPGAHFLLKFPSGDLIGVKIVQFLELKS